MNSAHNYSFTDTQGNPSTQDTQSKQIYQFIIVGNYFDETKDHIIKDLIDFQNKEKFDQYMRSIERQYYDKSLDIKVPYEEIPDFPPKPFNQTQRSNDRTKDYIDKVREAQEKRQASYKPLQQQKQPYDQYGYFDPDQNSINQYSSPYFDTAVNKENYTQSYNNFLGSQYHDDMPGFYTIPEPKPQAPVYQGFSQPSYYGDMMPRRMPPPSLQRFVAGPIELEKNPLTAPNRPNLRQYQHQSDRTLADYDLRNPDVQHERYKQLMTNQYYNSNINSQQPDGKRTLLKPPPVFNNTQAMNQYFQQMQRYPYQPYSRPQKQSLDVSFNPQGYPQQPPNYFSYQEKPWNVSLYQPPRGEIFNPNYYEEIKPEMYARLQHQNYVNKDVIQSIGGIENTLEPLEESFKYHEQRPYQFQKDYQQEYQESLRGRSLKRSNSEVRPDKMKLISASPYRAIVQRNEDDSVEDEINRQRPSSSMTESKRQQSPKISQQYQQDQFHQSLGSRRSLREDSQKKIRKEFEALRQEREQYLKRFAVPTYQSKPTMPPSNRDNRPNFQITS